MKSKYHLTKRRKRQQHKNNSKDARRHYQYVIQVGTHPAISFYSASPFQYESKKAAKADATRECERRNIKWNESMIHLRLGKEPVKLHTLYV